jgi:hypothetical protein
MHVKATKFDYLIIVPQLLERIPYIEALFRWLLLLFTDVKFGFPRALVHIEIELLEV